MSYVQSNYRVRHTSLNAFCVCVLFILVILLKPSVYVPHSFGLYLCIMLQCPFPNIYICQYIPEIDHTIYNLCLVNCFPFLKILLKFIFLLLNCSHEFSFCFIINILQIVNDIYIWKKYSRFFRVYNLLI